MSLIKLFFIFVKIGAILLGGGYVILPILQNEFVEKRGIVNNDELIDYYAIAQSLPGILAANISMFIGYKLKGKMGALCSVLGIIFVPFLLIVLLASIISAIVENSIIQGALWGIGIAVTVMILLTVKEIWQNTLKDSFFYTIFFLSLIALFALKLSPISVILIFSFVGIMFKTIQKRLNDKLKNGDIEK